MGGMAYDTVLKICEELSVSPIDFTPLESGFINDQLLENKIMQRFLKLNKKGRNKIIEQMDDYLELPKYTEI